MGRVQKINKVIFVVDVVCTARLKKGITLVQINSKMQFSIISFESKYAADFIRINLEWLDKYELTEPADIFMLENYQSEILDTGGAIFLVKAGDTIVGSAALIYEGNGLFELAKMAVIVQFQGRGISNMLIEKCLEKALELGATKVYLVSNSRLTTAIGLYRKYGFINVPVTNNHYVNADVMMEKVL
jgi:N-acetylglutamate synthase-like GNAT family acetyltransferase